MSPQNVAAWIRAPKADLEIDEAPYNEPGPGEILIRNEAIAIQPLDASVRKAAYMPIPYPFILGSNVAGTIEAIGPGVEDFKIGERVVSSTPTYVTKETKWGGWQKFVSSKPEMTAKIGEANYDRAVAISFPLSTAVSALQVYAGMAKPGEGDKNAYEQDKVLIWGAGGAVGGFAHLETVGASKVVDYKSPNVEAQLRELGPFKFLMTASGDPTSQQVLASLLQPNGGRFISVRAGEVELPKNVDRIYNMFEAAGQGPEFRHWWYTTYLPEAIGGAVEPTPIEKRSGGLKAIQAAGDDVFSGKAKDKIIVNPQE
uniref:Putative alcohol dehydrogenase n=1 Tax=Cladonia uncialis subsp. uncialis TaxID=180999 RepID=A0A1Z1C4V1_CLAUC|nr:putative alcohol dehydrogenase [Cladonia uncialis subsp. uncialis]AUW30841.1 putative alcohol dehydrogenase [Cladonia uncialis subsp. uncialis]